MWWCPMCLRSLSRIAVIPAIVASLALPGFAWGGEPLDHVWPRISGGQGGARAGTAIGLGDLNDDGYDDLVVGADGCKPGLQYPAAGCVAVFYGGLWPMGTELRFADADVIIYGAVESENLGAALTVRGDVNDDGIVDLVIAAPGYSGGVTRGGRVGIFFGGVTLGSSVSLDDADVLIEGARDLTALGSCLDSGRDMDGDGVDDLLIGSTGARDAQGDTRGAVFLAYGTSSWPSSMDMDLDNTPGAHGDGTNAGFATSCAAVEDQDGDGADDILVGAPRAVNGLAQPPLPFAGQVFLLSGAEAGGGGVAADLALASWLGTGGYFFLGEAVADPGSLDADAAGDLAFAAIGHDELGVGTGQIYVFFNDGQAAWGIWGDPEAGASLTLTGESPGGLAGSALTGVGDVTGDGVDDLAVAAPELDDYALSGGRVYLIAGDAALGGVSSLSSASYSWDGEQGLRVADSIGAGEFSGLGGRELVLGTIRGGAGSPADGGVRIYAFDDPDGDGFCTDAVCPGGLLPDDCDGTDPAAYPGAQEVPYDGIDQSCDGLDLVDVDSDGYAAVVVGGPDCDDDDPAIHPAAGELLCDGVDQDCDGVDLTDGDGDGYDAYVCGGADCDDSDAAAHPGAPEIADGRDDDCDGLIDEGTVLADDDGDGFCESAVECSDESLPGDCNDDDPSIYPGALEWINAQDDDCDSLVDEETDVYDDDGDGYTELGGDCDDTDPDVHPGADEVSGNQRDDDCDGWIDEEHSPLSSDLDGDGYCPSNIACGDGSETGDCDDTDPQVHPGSEEIPYDGVDQDCDGLDPTDLDGDGYDAEDVGGADCDDLDANVHPGRVDLEDGIDQDCDGDTDEDAYLANPELEGGCRCSSGSDDRSAGTGVLLAGLSLVLLLTGRRGRIRRCTTEL